MNLVILSGNVGRDPEVREFDNSKIVSFTFATTKRGFKTQDGKEVPDKTLWHNVTCRGKLGEIVEKYVKKGTKLNIVGEINYREYTKDDTKHTVTEIIADKIDILSSADKSNDKPF